MPAKSLITDLVIRYGFQVLGALVILLAGVILARSAGNLVDRRLQRSTMEPPTRKLLTRVVRVVVLLFAFVVALDKFGFQVAPLVAGIGVAGLGVGFALQGVLSNLVAGLTIIVTKPFRVGEYIELLGVHGEVTNIELSSTTLLHADRSRVIIPNRKIVGEILHNYGTIRQLHLTLTVPHTTDLDRALTLASEAVRRDVRVLKDVEPALGVAGVSENGVRLSINPWVRGADAGAAEGDLYRALLESYRAADIGVGVPRREIRVVEGAPLR